MQMIAHEAPAWAISMVVHMVSLVTMAMVTVPAPVPYKPHSFVVTPPEEAIEEVWETLNIQPTTLEEKPGVDSMVFDSAAELENSTPDVSNEPDSGAGAMEPSEYGPMLVPKEMLTSLTGNSNNGYEWREMSEKRKLEEGASNATEKCVFNALKWLANHQMPDGGWSFNHAACPSCQGQCRDPGKMAEARIAATGLALLPFLGTGQTHKESKRYKATIGNGLNFLVNHMRIGPKGGALNEEGSGNMYSHGIAAIALCEAYAMTRDKNLLVPARASLNFICSSQDPVGGGWRYQPREKGDTSVLGWQLMALKSGYMANLAVSKQTYHKASHFLDGVQSDSGAVYGYTDPGSKEATTAIGLLCRMYLGWKKDNPALQRGVMILSNHGPSPGNMYFNYYATQVMRHWEGEEWEKWNRQMRDQLIHIQAKQGHEEGSWFINSGGNADLGAAAGGRLYVTAMAAMILEVYYRNMPIYRTQSVNQDFPD
jgi:hypothetical protein